MSPVTCYPSPVTCHLSPVTWYLSPVTCHLSPVTRHLSPVTCQVTSDKEWQSTIDSDALHYHGGAKALQGHVIIQCLDRWVIWLVKIMGYIKWLCMALIITPPASPSSSAKWPCPTSYCMVARIRWACAHISLQHTKLCPLPYLPPQICTPSGSEALHAAASSQDKTLKVRQEKFSQKICYKYLPPDTWHLTRWWRGGCTTCTWCRTLWARRRGVPP